MKSVWDDEDMKVGGDFIKFDDINDTVTGTITAIRKHVWADGSASPQLFLMVDGEEKTLTAGQIRLKAALAEQRPDVGDTLTVTLKDIEKRAGGKTLKIFDVAVTRAGGAPAAPAAPVTADEAVAAGALTAEQRAALAKVGL